MRAGRKGMILSPTHCANIAAALKGRKMLPESVEKAAATRRGRKMPPEFGEKIRQRLLGRVPTEQAKANHSKGWRNSEACKAHLRALCAQNIGKKRSEEVRARMRAGWVKRREAAALKG
jgi:hypothetical protein